MARKNPQKATAQRKQPTSGTSSKAARQPARKIKAKPRAKVATAKPPAEIVKLKPLPWWGDSEVPPHLRWPGVTIEIKAEWNSIMQRWEDGDYYFDAVAADKVCGFFSSCLTHSKGEFAGSLFTLLDWQSMLVIRPIFGWKSKVTHLRRFRKVYVEVPKKNGKSKLCAGLGLYMTFGDAEDGSEVYCAAADREQAAIVFEEARAMVEDCESLAESCEVFRRSITHPETRSSFKVLSADARTKHGPNVHCLIFDELHAQKDRVLFETLEKGIAARRQPLIVMITTAGDDQESICFEQHEYALNVMKDGGDNTFLPVVFSTPKDADWTKEEVWAAVNPSLGVTVKYEYLRNEIVAAIKEPRKQNTFKQLHLDVWTQQAKLWITIESWDACKVEIYPENLRGLPVAAGLDLSSKIDLSSLVLAFRHDDPPGVPAVEIDIEDLGKLSPDEQLGLLAQAASHDPGTIPKKKMKINFSVTLLPYFWMPEQSLSERKAKDRFGYDVMKEAGLIELTEGNIIDYDAIYDCVKRLSPIYKLKDAEIGYDPWNGTQISTQLTKDGFKMVEVPQTMLHLSEASKVFEALVLAKRIRHSGHRVLRWNVENVAVKEDASGNIKPVKPSPMKRIDGVVASILAVGRLIARKPKSGPSAMWI